MAGGHSKPWCYDVRGNKNWGYCGNLIENILLKLESEICNCNVTLVSILYVNIL